VTIRFGENEEFLIMSQLVGKYNFENILAAACIGRYFKIPDQHIINAIQDYIPQNNRSQIIQKGTSNIILDAYNANPSSMNAAIDSFKEIKAQNKAIILGDMFELGEFEESEHTKIIEKLIDFKKIENNTQLFIAGKAFYNSVRKFNDISMIHAYETTDQLIKELRNCIFHDSRILIKGSRGMKMERIVEHLNFT